MDSLPSQFRDLVHPIKIATPFAVGEVFSYLITDEKNILVDCGHHAENAFSAVQKALQQQGLAIEDVDEIWLTHGHPDHFGQAARLADLSGADLYGHTKERSNFAGNDDQELFQNFFAKHQIPSALAEGMVQQLDWLQQYQLPVEPQWIKDGEHLTSGRLSVCVKSTPGHAPGHVVFDTEEGLLFGGDLLLDHISTNALINFDPDTGRRNKSLLQYRDSLQWIANQEGRVLPGHGKPIDDIAIVAHHHLQEHQKRYLGIQQLLDDQSMSLLGIAQHLFADAIEQGAIFLVLSEVLGYLDWGEQEGTIRKVTTSDGIFFEKI